MLTKKTTYLRKQRAKRVALRVSDRSDLPRLHVKRSLLHFHAQIIDLNGKVLAQASTTQLKDFKGHKTAASQLVGQNLGEAAKKAGITSVVLIRGSYRFHGRLKAMVEAFNKSGVMC